MALPSAFRTSQSDPGPAEFNILAQDTTVKPALSFRQANDSSFGYDVDLEVASVGRMDWFRVVSGARTLFMSILRASGNVGIGKTPDAAAKFDVEGSIKIKSFAKAALPSAAAVGQMIYVSDDIGGAVIAFSDGTNWRRVTDRAIIA
jgi:hypothetical protein